MKIPQKYKGILFIVLSAFFFSCMNVCVRLSGDLPTLQKVFFRNAIAAVVAAVLLAREGKGFFPANRRNWPRLLARCVFGTTGMVCNFYAVDHLALSDASMLAKMAPFFAVIASFFLLKERISTVQLVSLCGAFLGALLIIKPTLGNLDLVPALAGLFGGFCSGVAYTLVRTLGQRGERGPVIVFVFSAFSCLTTLPFILLNYAPMTLAQLLFLLGAGVCAAAAQFSVTAAYCSAPAREISVYDYSQVIFGAVLGFLIFGDVPDIFSFLGYIIIFSMALLNFRHSSHTAK